MIIRRITKPSTSLSVFLLILTLFLPFSTILFSGTPVLAKTSYVKPSSEVVVRKGQGIKYKIVAVVKDGVSVKFLEEGDSYAKVRLANGKEGWMLKRFLSDEPPLEQVVASLRTEKEKMKRKEIEATGKQQPQKKYCHQVVSFRRRCAACRNVYWDEIQQVTQENNITPVTGVHFLHGLIFTAVTVLLLL